MVGKKSGGKGKKTPDAAAIRKANAEKERWRETTHRVSDAKHIARLRRKVRLVRDVEDTEQRHAETARRILEESRKRPAPPIRTVGSKQPLNASERTIARLIAKETRLPLRGIVRTIQKQPEIAKKQWPNFF